MFSFFIRKRLHYSSCRQDEIIVIVVGRWRIQFCLQKGFSSRHGLMIFCPSAVHLGLAQVLYALCPSAVLPVCLLPKWCSPLLLPESGRRGAAGRCQVLAQIREDRGAQYVPVCGAELWIREGRRLEEAADGRRARRQAAAEQIGPRMSLWNYFCGANFSIFRSKYGELLEMYSFLHPYTYLESWQTINFGKKKLGTIGDALKLLDLRR